MAWLPNDFIHPKRVELATGQHLRPIRASDVDIDYPAVMGSPTRLWLKYGEAWGWPPPDMTLEADRVDLARHAGSHLRLERLERLERIRCGPRRQARRASVTATTPQTAASSWKARAPGVHVVDIVSGKDVWSKPEGAVIATRANGIALFDRHGNSTL